MSVLIRLAERNHSPSLSRLTKFAASYAKAAQSEQKVMGEFRVLELIPKKQERAKFVSRVDNVPPPRSESMALDQDWVSVWPAARTFHPATVPIPIRQGYPLKGQAPPGKFGNTELMKIPNFLHLTPPAVKRHCEALKQFCTEWPKELTGEEQCAEHFPLERITSDYCYSGPTIRDPLARIVTLRVKMSSLTLNYHAKDKLLRLLGERYNPETDLITITVDRCPTRKQNMEYAEYLLTAVYHEAWRVEPWEAEKTLADMEYYDWEQHASHKSLLAIHAWPNTPAEDLDYKTIPHAEEYKNAVSRLINEGEDLVALNAYGKAVKNMLNIKSRDDK